MSTLPTIVLGLSTSLTSIDISLLPGLKDAKKPKSATCFSCKYKLNFKY